MNEVLATSTRTRAHHELVGSETELRQAIDTALADARPGGLVVMGGHFMLVEDEATGRLTPGITGEQSSAVMRRRVSGRVGIFPEYTWDLSVDLLTAHAPRYDDDARLLLLINDWQYVPRARRSASELRAEFYEGFDRLPAAYERALHAAGHTTDRVLASRKHPLAFPETWLKYRFQKSADKLVKQGLLEKRVLDSGDNDSEISFLDADGNYRTLMSCGVTGCAGEITEMITEVHRTGYRNLVIFAPGECLAPVQTGVSTALDLHQLRDMVVVVADPGGSGETTTDEIYANLVTVSTFRS